MTYLINVKAKKIHDNILKQWKNVDSEYLEVTAMTRDFITVLVAEVECERVFNVVKALYDHRKSYNSKIFFAYMMIRFHDQNVNAQTKLNADFLTKEDKIIQNMKKKMKKRMNELKNVYDKLYISDDDEKKVVRKTTTQTFTTIRFLCYTSFTRRLFDKNTERKKT